MNNIVAFITTNWVQISVSWLIFIKFITVLRDAIDKTPGKDTNRFERAVSILGKVTASLSMGARPKEDTK